MFNIGDLVILKKPYDKYSIINKYVVCEVLRSTNYDNNNQMNVEIIKYLPMTKADEEKYGGKRYIQSHIGYTWNVDIDKFKLYKEKQNNIEW
jgi:hypothetical protein